MKRLLITGQLHQDALAALASDTLSVDYEPQIQRSHLLRIVGDYHVLLTRSGTTVDQELLDKATQLELVARAGVGIANIDLEYATHKGILVINAPGVNTISAAELTISLLMAMVRQIPSAQHTLKQGGWDRHLFEGTELAHKTIGLIGLGNVGRRVAQICHGLQMKVEAYDPYLTDEIFEAAGVSRRHQLRGEHGLLRHCDILSPHVPLNEETTGLIARDELMELSPGSWVVNTSRGGVICEQALLEVLEANHLAGAAIDTWQNEPTPHAMLVQHPKVYGTPHIGALTLEAQRKVGLAIVNQLNKALDGEVVDHPVNIPGMHSHLTSPLRAKMVLCEKLGRLSQQILEFQPTTLTLHLPPGLDDNAGHLLVLAFQKGFLYRVTNEFVSYANANAKFAAAGMSASYDATSPGATHPTGAPATTPPHRASRGITATLADAKGHQLSLRGVVYDDLHPRLTHLGEFALEVRPEGHFLVFRNQDVPGVVGGVGQFLARHNINIDSFYLSSHNLEGQAMAMVKIHRCLTKSQCDEMQTFPFIDKLFAVDL